MHADEPELQSGTKSGYMKSKSVDEPKHSRTADKADIDYSSLRSKLKHASTSLEKNRPMECKRIAREVLETAKTTKRKSADIADIFSVLVDIFNKVFRACIIGFIKVYNFIINDLPYGVTNSICLWLSYSLNNFDFCALLTFKMRMLIVLHSL